MNVKELIKKIGEMPIEHFSLVMECATILSQLEKEEQDKLLELMDLIMKFNKEENKK